MLIDCPDPDTNEAETHDSNLARLHQLLPYCDVLIYTSTQQKYRSARVGDELAQAAKLRLEAQALLASFDKKKADAEAQAATIIAEARAQAEQIAKDAAVRMDEFVTRRTAQAEGKIAFAEAQATAQVRAAAADHAARAAEIVLRGEARGSAGAELVSREIGALKARLN